MNKLSKEMNSSDENKIARIFAEHYGWEDGLEIERCIKSIILHKDLTFQEKLVSALTKNGWSAADARAFAEGIVELSQR